MNPTAQKSHTTALRTLERSTQASLEELRTLLQQDIPAAIRESIGKERSARLTLAGEQRAYVDGQIERIRGLIAAEAAEVAAFRHRGFWSRVHWLVTGR